MSFLKTRSQLGMVLTEGKVQPVEGNLTEKKWAFLELVSRLATTQLITYQIAKW